MDEVEAALARLEGSVTRLRAQAALLLRKGFIFEALARGLAAAGAKIGGNSKH